MKRMVRRLALAAVRLLVWLYPPRYRRRTGEEMVEAFRERLDDRAKRGAGAMIRVATRTVADVVVSALSEWFFPSDRVSVAGRRLELARDRRVRILDAVRIDLRFAWRALARRPVFTAVAVFTLALGVGANTVFFSAVNAVLLRPLSLGDPDRLVAVWETDATKAGTRELVAPANLFDWRERVSAFLDVSGFGSGVATIGGDALPEVVPAALVMGNFFDVAGVRAAYGRALADAETWTDASPVVVLSDGFWARRWGRDPAVLGSMITIDEVTREVVGIMPRGFTFPDDVDVWLPMGWYRAAPRQSWFRREHFLRVFARLDDDVTLERAGTELRSVASRLQEEHPAANAGIGAGITPLQAFLAGESRAPLLLLLGASGMVLLLACANVANLLLARASGRRRELAVRAALGASRARVAAQLITESLLLATAGGIAGVGTAVIGIRGIGLLRPPDTYRMDGLSLDGRVLVFAIIITLATGLLFGLAPALLGAASNGAGALESGTRSTSGRHARRVSGALVVAEVVLAVLLATSAGLLLRSFVALRRVDPGFRIDDRVAASIILPRRYDSDAHIMQFLDDFVSRVERIGGVHAVTYATRLPFMGTMTRAGLFWENADMQSVSVDGHVVSSGEHVGSRLVASNYFDVMGVPLLRGRMFDDRDLPGSERVVVINERMARRFPAGRDPIGQRITWDEAPNDSSMWFRIVGVVGDEHQNGVHVPPPMETFTPFRQLPGVRVRLIVHTRTSIATLAPELRAQLAAVDPLLALDGLRSLDDMYASQFGRDRLLLALIGGFAVLALVLASVGVYGLMAEMVARRTFEIGIRVALGAASHDIAGIVIRQGFALTAIGAAIGLLAALAGTRLLAGVLFGVAPTDAVTFTGVIAILLLVALIACAVPAHRAARLEPTEALRHG